MLPEGNSEVHMGTSSTGTGVLGLTMVTGPQQSMETANLLHTSPHSVCPHNLPFTHHLDNPDHLTASQLSISPTLTSAAYCLPIPSCLQIAGAKVHDGDCQPIQTLDRPLLAKGLHYSRYGGHTNDIYNFTGPAKQTSKVLHNMVSCAATVLRQANELDIPTFSLSLRAITGGTVVPEEPMVPRTSPLDCTLNLNILIADSHCKKSQAPNSLCSSLQTLLDAQTIGLTSQADNANLRGLSDTDCLIHSFENEFSHQSMEKPLRNSLKGIDAIQDGEASEDHEISTLGDTTHLNQCNQSNVSILDGSCRNNLLVDEPIKRTSSSDLHSANMSRSPNVCPLMVNYNYKNPKQQQELKAFASQQTKWFPQIHTSVPHTNDLKPTGSSDMPDWENVHLPKCLSPLHIIDGKTGSPQSEEQLKDVLHMDSISRPPSFSPPAASLKNPQWLSHCPKGPELPVSFKTNVKLSKTPRLVPKCSRPQDLSYLSPLNNFTVEKSYMLPEEMQDVNGNIEEEDEINIGTGRYACVKRRVEKVKQCEVVHKKQKLDCVCSPMKRSIITEKRLNTETNMLVRSSGGTDDLSVVRRLPRQSPSRSLKKCFSKIPRDSKNMECSNANRNSQSRLSKGEAEKHRRWNTVEKIYSSSEKESKGVKESLIQTKQDGAMVGNSRKGKRKAKSKHSLLSFRRPTPAHGSQMTCSSERPDYPNLTSTPPELSRIALENQNLGHAQCQWSETEKRYDAVGRKDDDWRKNKNAEGDLEDAWSGNYTVTGDGPGERTLYIGETETEHKTDGNEVIQSMRVSKIHGKYMTKAGKLKIGERVSVESHCNNFSEAVATYDMHETEEAAREPDDHPMGDGRVGSKLAKVSRMETFEKSGGSNSQFVKLKKMDMRHKEIDATGDAETGREKSDQKTTVTYKLETAKQVEVETFRGYQKACTELAENRYNDNNTTVEMDLRKQLVEEGQEEINVEIKVGEGKNDCNLEKVYEHSRKNHMRSTFQKLVSTLEDEEVDILDFPSPPTVWLSQLPRSPGVDLSARESSEDDQEIDVIS